MKRILGIDLGTNSLGWAIMGIPADKKEPIRLLDKGVVLFDEGVIVEKGNEKSKAAERTKYRSARRLKFRRKLRKYKTLRVLARNGMVPLDTDEVDAWRRSNFKKYPLNPEFLEWLRTDENLQKNPYRLRAKALDEKLTPYELGRVFYHLAQRRGFLSNRLERNKKDNETGKVKTAISELTKAMEAAGARTVGEYFWMLYQQDRTNPENKIRTRYLGRKEHYLQEFEAICKAQALEENLCKELHNAIFYQRPLKSQKGLVGKCVFEPKKPRIPVSHPVFEEFRMWSFINNIKIKTIEDDDLRFLTAEEIDKIIPLFESAPSKKFIKFKDIAKKLVPTSAKNGKMAYYKSREAKGAHILFNYPLDQSVATSPVRAFFKKYIGEDWSSKVFRYMVDKRNGKQVEKSANWKDIWHILFTFEDEDKIKEYVTKKLGLNEETANKFAEFALPEGYASLSHKAINKILPFLKQGYTYDKAVLLAKVPDILGAMWEDDGIKQEVFDFVNRAFDRQTYEQRLKRAVNRTLYEIHKKRISDRNSREQILTGHLESIFGYRTKKQLDESHDLSREALQLLLERLAVSKNIDEQIIKQETIEQQLKDFLEKLYKEYELKDLNEKEKQDKLEKFKKKLKGLYHPSMTDIYRRPPVERDGKKFLGSPIVDSIKNPVMMRSMHMLRKLVNTLIAKEKIDEETVVHLELARDLHDANMRKAIKEYQRKREKDNERYKEEIKKIFSKNGILREPTKDDIRRYRLREEQNGVDVYTGKSIADHELFDGTKYDIEHTVPRSLSYDNSLANLTVTSSKFNREVKRNKLPSELDNYNEIKARMDIWYKNREKFEKEIENLSRKIRAATTKEAKDNLIVKRHVARMHKDYWDRKIKLFELEEVPEDFKVSQLNDTRILTRYARAYLKTIFPKVHVVNGNMTATFRELWGLQEQGEKKDRSNHIHHAIDAAVIAAITRNMYNRLAEALHKDEEGLKAEARDMIAGMKPWETFTEDMKNLHRETVVFHDFRDILPKHSKKKVRKRGVIQYTYVTELPNWFRHLIEQGVYREGINYWREIKDGKERFKIPVFAQGDTARGVLHRETFYGAIARKDEKGNIIKNKNGEIEVDYVVRKYVADLSEKDAEKIIDPVIRDIVLRDKIREKGFNTQIDKIKKSLRIASEDEEKVLNEQLTVLETEKSKLYRLPTKKGGFVPIRKVRIKTRVNEPIPEFKKHRDMSKTDYKQWYYVENKENYGMAIYEGNDDKGRLQRDFEIISNLRAAEYFKRSNANDRQSENRKYENLIPSNKNGLPLKYILKKGMTVMFYRESPEELKELSREELVNRLFKILILEGVNIWFIPIQLGGKKQDLKKNNSSQLVFDGQTILRISRKNWNFIVNGIEFDMDIDGEIRFRF